MNQVPTVVAAQVDPHLVRELYDKSQVVLIKQLVLARDRDTSASSNNNSNRNDNDDERISPSRTKSRGDRFGLAELRASFVVQWFPLLWCCGSSCPQNQKHS